MLHSRTVAQLLGFQLALIVQKIDYAVGITPEKANKSRATQFKNEGQKNNPNSIIRIHWAYVDI